MNFQCLHSCWSGESLSYQQAGEIKEMKSVKCVEKDFTLNENAEENIIPDVKPAENNWERLMQRRQVRK